MGWTFQSLIDERMKVTAFCLDDACRNVRVLPLEELRDRFGPDAPAMRDDILPRLRCDACGGKNVDLTCVPDHSARAPENPYSKAKGG
ncbi:hypothetical protein SAMN04488498_104313 [Mesorhizobium albiziae]|uniref:Uncharacterized protein n=1 Tax=Neomesorhizobium albiziae TaxID=335020 RepID=A0A1I3YAA3_9HYPH|nr:hypothetical protein [Mesorhizobium albiziae]GLS29982.1 hypothetical protein GCM10007937_16900 [Mesorhizobium albiziae]SFK28897.1 hypothetical protein SAMN04488498_104313 [Mesorhizobium albiziae]